MKLLARLSARWLAGQIKNRRATAKKEINKNISGKKTIWKYIFAGEKYEISNRCGGQQGECPIPSTVGLSFATDLKISSGYAGKDIKPIRKCSLKQTNRRQYFYSAHLSFFQFVAQLDAFPLMFAPWESNCCCSFIFCYHCWFLTPRQVNKFRFKLSLI